jgi:hypothetical protein
LFIVSLFIVLITGCARSVTSYVNYGTQMVVEVTLRGTIETTANRYFLVLARTAAYSVPLPLPYNVGQYEMIEPGTAPRSGTWSDYQTNFYCSWEGYCLTEANSHLTVKGPFTYNVTPSREVITSVGERTNKLSYTFSLSKIFGASIPDTIYFDLVTVPWPNADLRLPADHLAITDAYVSKIAGSTRTVPDEENLALDAAVDIKECTVTIQ